MSNRKLLIISIQVAPSVGDNLLEIGQLAQHKHAKKPLSFTIKKMNKCCFHKVSFPLQPDWQARLYLTVIPFFLGEQLFAIKNYIPIEKKLPLEKRRDLFLLQRKLNFKDWGLKFSSFHAMSNTFSLCYTPLRQCIMPKSIYSPPLVVVDCSVQKYLLCRPAYSAIFWHKPN